MADRAKRKVVRKERRKARPERHRLGKRPPLTRNERPQPSLEEEPVREQQRQHDQPARPASLDGALDHVGRYDAGVAVLAALRHWPNAARAQWCARLLAGLGRFTDSFTASTQRLYETHKVLIAERTVDAMVDDVTFRGDRVRAYLDEEEQVIRRRILADWRDACGR